jgi:hypothetical protein
MTQSNTLNGKVHQPKRSRVSRAAEETIKPADEQEAAKMNALNRFLQAQEDMLREWGAPSGKRAMVAFATSLVIAFGVGFIGGLIIEAVVMAALMFTGSAFIGFMLWALGVVAVVIGGSTAAANTYAYIVSKKIDAHYAQAKSWAQGVVAQANALMQRGDKPEPTVH